MRILITVFPKQPVFYTIVPLAWACRLAGHEVRVAAAPALAETVLAAGLPVVPVGPAGGPAEMVRRAGIGFRPPEGLRDDHVRWPADWAREPVSLGLPHRRYFEEITLMSAAIAEAQLDDLLAFGRAWSPDLIIHDATQFAGAVAARVAGVPAARYLIGIPGLHRLETTYGPELAPAYVRLFEKSGVEPAARPAAWIDPCPPALQYPYPGDERCLPMRHIPYNGPGEVPGWADRPATRPRVCVTWGGTLVEWEGAGMVDRVRQTLEALSALDVEVVVALSPRLRGLLGETPDNARFAVSVPLNLILPSCGLVIHHAGPGTSIASAACGVPQYTITNHPHNALIGARIEAAGAGRNTLLTDIPEGAAGVAEIRRTADALLSDPAYRRAAGRIKEEVAGLPSPVEVAAELERLAEKVPVA
ncbi:nucleotide disphospho-sugar-binding domain-containing protein [Amycolatopsis sp. NPDC049688]|uniref:nucleotide disphospho-sugar-binding domain-containing protein n=1 Tax=Amycolatopsis sp. NPDC049688 TaxID=3154733 RepID=UPI0034378834